MVEFILGASVLMLGLIMGFAAGAAVMGGPERSLPRRRAESSPGGESCRFEEDNRAFRDMLGYSADIAYGVTEMEKSE